eukprot:CAMPEP_0202030132 /NCGR_PEP_ID=MMETSP0905-20130828/64340_1 /ASSEMBLY_ACC=CAM_ASM_000554 /TAXON_ID=420261 /ORGANISM="Thalassiosira antarctica, Strain CCMP982" /LENGTH=114 /DNA_ID=CAMNT_0048593921 /DNA_START=482 /DNA_END=823 /DNA_ORIENTATION=-
MNPRRTTKPIPTPVNLRNLSPAPDLASPRCPPTYQCSAPRHAAANTYPNADPTQDQQNLLKPLQIRQSHADPVLTDPAPHVPVQKKSPRPPRIHHTPPEHQNYDTPCRQRPHAE